MGSKEKTLQDKFNGDVEAYNIWFKERKSYAGSNSPGNFRNDRQRAVEAGKASGKARLGLKRGSYKKRKV